MSGNGLVTISAAAVILGIKPRSVRMLRERGVLQGRQIDGRTWVVTRASIEAFLIRRRERRARSASRRNRATQ